MDYHQIRQKERIRTSIDQLKRFSFWLSLIAVLVIIYDLGFTDSDPTENKLANFYFLALFVGSFTIIARYFIRQTQVLPK